METFYKPFYTRRILRIVPVYLAMVALLKLTGSISWRFTAVSLLYLCNVSGLLHSTPEYGSFWSLSVEEQFYLIWPCLVRRLSSSALLLLAVMIVIGTPLLRYLLLYAPTALGDIHYKTWAVGDFFAAGALLAMLVRSSRHNLVMRRIANVCCAVGLLLGAIAAVMPQIRFQPLLKLQEAIYLTLWLPLFTGIVLIAYLVPGIADSRLARIFIFLGRIRYGLYLVYSYIFSLATNYWPMANISLSAAHLFSLLLLRFFMESTVAIIIAFLSRVSVEEYFLRLKPHETRIRAVKNKFT